MKVISVENVSKKFILAHDRPRNLADAARGVFCRSKREDFWALKDVSFEVEQGQALGIIGHNGAGKSTMLKLLTRIMQPTSGRIRTRGRVSALIEVGAGFHPEMTGRENIYLNGSILGMTRAEIDRKFDEIVAFAELEQFIDTPVKRYSSGMYARLGFAVAAHVDPEILIVDEVLAVGDGGFQAKCSQQMSELCAGGATVILVSHNLSAIETFADKCLLLSGGKAGYIGSPREAIKLYLDDMSQRFGLGQCGIMSNSRISITDVALHDSNGGPVTDILGGEDLTIDIGYVAHEQIRRPHVSIGISDGRIGALCLASTLIDNQCPEVLEGEGRLSCTFSALPLKPRTYDLWFSIRTPDGTADIIDWQRVGAFNVAEGQDAIPQGQSSMTHTRFYAPVSVPYSWRYY